MNQKKFLAIEKIADTKVLLVISTVVLFVSFFIANFVLSLLQEILRFIGRFAKTSELGRFHVSFQDFLHFQPDLKAFYIGFYGLVLFVLLKFIINMKMNYGDLNKGQHGTSEFATVKELKQQYKIIPGSKEPYEGDSGAIVSAIQKNNRFKILFNKKTNDYKLLIDTGPVHTLIIGITRSGKGERWVFPMIDVISRASKKSSMVVNDPKGELAAASYDTLKRRGYDVYIFNLIKQSKSMGFNPLQPVIDAYKKGDVSLAQQYANSIAFSLYHDPNAKDPFWNNSAKSLVTAIILAITEDCIKLGKEERINMYSVAHFLNTKGSAYNENDENELDLFFRARDENNPARLMYATSNFAAGNTRASIFSTAMDKLQIFTLTPNAKFTSYNSLDLTEVGFGEKPIAIFMVIPDQDKSNHVLSSIFVSQLYRMNAEKATMTPGGKMKRNVVMLLDEFGNMPPIEGMASMVTVGAGRGFRFNLVIQSYGQIKTLYGDDADTIIGNCSNQLYILTEDVSTAERFSSMLGKKTITDRSRSGKFLSTDKSVSESVKERALLMPDELMKLKEGESVVVRANKRQDKKGRKIVPKPIFNTGVTASKARYEYLADDFDNSKSFLDLPIVSNHDQIRLEDIVYTAKSDEDVYVRMRDMLDTTTVNRLKSLIRKDLSNSIRLNAEESIQMLDMLDLFTFQQFFSFICYYAPLSTRSRLDIFKYMGAYLPKSVIETWKEKAAKLRESEENEAPSDVEIHEYDDWIKRAVGESHEV